MQLLLFKKNIVLKKKNKLNKMNKKINKKKLKNYKLRIMQFKNKFQINKMMKPTPIKKPKMTLRTILSFLFLPKFFLN